MLSVLYSANGFSHVPTEEDRRYGFFDYIFWNPHLYKVKVDITIYYEKKSPVKMESFELEPESIDKKIVFPQDYPNLVVDGGSVGAKIVTNALIFVETIMSAGELGSHAKTLRTDEGDNRIFRGGVADMLAEPRTCNLWYFADGYLIQKDQPYESGGDVEESKASFSEIEWYHVLNPNKRDAEVTMQCFYLDRTRDSFSYKVGAERVLMFDNYNLVKPNLRYGIKFISTEPVVVQCERLIHDLSKSGRDDWGMATHTPRPGIPAPLIWNEEIE